MTKRFSFIIGIAAALLTCGQATAQILPSGAQVVQGTELPNRGYPVNVLNVDQNGNVVIGSGAAAQQVQGNSASGAADVGSPIKVGCVFNTTPATVTTGQRSDANCSSNGILYVVPHAPASATLPSWIAPADTLANPGANTVFGVFSYGAVFDGTNWFRQRGDVSGAYVVEVPSAASAAGVAVNATTVASGSLVAKASAGNLYGYNVTSGASAGYVLIFNATSAPADGTVTPARCIPLAANTGIEVDMRGQPTFFSTGITIVFSTTGCFTKTISATAFISADVK